MIVNAKTRLVVCAKATRVEYEMPYCACKVSCNLLPLLKKFALNVILWGFKQTGAHYTANVMGKDRDVYKTSGCL